MPASVDDHGARRRSAGGRRRRPRIVVVAHHDSFTYNLVHALELAEARCRVVVDGEQSVEQLLALPADGLVLSAGPCSPAQTKLGVPLVRAWCRRRRQQPLLGVCLGHQIIAVALGGAVRRARQPVHGKRVDIRHDRQSLFRSLPNPFGAARYNSLVVCADRLPAALAASAWGADGEIMALRHRSLPIAGVQFHPESILSEGGPALFSNWVAAARAAADACEAAQARAGYAPP